MAALQIGWGRVARSVVGVTLATLVAARLAGVEVPGAALGLAVVLEGFIAVTLAWVVISTLRGRRSGSTFDELRSRLSRTLPRPVVRIALGELELAAAALRTLLRRPLPKPTGFSSMRTSQSGFFIPAAILLTLVEAPALHVLLGLWLGSDALWPHVAVLILNVYGLAWLLADRRLMQESAHRFDEAGLALHLGARWRGHLGWEELAKVIRLEPGKVPDAQPLTRQVTPWDAPNVHLCLHRPVTLTTFFGLPLRAQHLDLFVDDPDGFVAAVLDGHRASAATRSR